MKPSSARIRKSDGFTLVELLISISIIVIITAAIVPSFAGYLRNQALKQAQEQLKSDLRSIQNKALTGALSDQLINGNPVAYWAVRFSPGGGGTGSNRYEYFISDSANASACPSTALDADLLQGYSDISQGIEVKSAEYKCLFYSLANGAITAVNFAGSEVIVGYSGSLTEGDCKRLKFNTNGLIYSVLSTACL